MLEALDASRGRSRTIFAIRCRRRNNASRSSPTPRVTSPCRRAGEWACVTDDQPSRRRDVGNVADGRGGASPTACSPRATRGHAGTRTRRSGQERKTDDAMAAGSAGRIGFDSVCDGLRVAACSGWPFGDTVAETRSRRSRGSIRCCAGTIARGTRDPDLDSVDPGNLARTLATSTTGPRLLLTLRPAGAVRFTGRKEILANVGGELIVRWIIDGLDADDRELQGRGMTENVVAKMQLRSRRGLPLRMARDVLRRTNDRLLEGRGTNAKDVRLLMVDPNCALTIAHMTRSLSFQFHSYSETRRRILSGRGAHRTTTRRRPQRPMSTTTLETLPDSRKTAVGA